RLLCLFAERLDVDTLLRKERGERDDDAAADRGVAVELQPVDRGDQVVALVRRLLYHHRGAGEGDDSQAHVARLLLDELARRGLRGGQAGGVCSRRPRALTAWRS